MEIFLSPDNENFIQSQIAAGLYKSAGDIIAEAMNLLKLKKNISSDRINAFKAEIQKGIDDIEAGRYTDGDDFFKKLISEYEQT